MSHAWGACKGAWKIFSWNLESRLKFWTVPREGHFGLFTCSLWNGTLKNSSYVKQAMWRSLVKTELNSKFSVDFGRHRKGRKGHFAKSDQMKLKMRFLGTDTLLSIPRAQRWAPRNFWKSGRPFNFGLKVPFWTWRVGWSFHTWKFWFLFQELCNFILRIFMCSE